MVEKQQSGLGGERRVRELHARLSEGVDLPVPLTFQALVREAAAHLEDADFSLISRGAGTNETTTGNVAAFDRWRISPHVLRDVAERDLCVRLFDRDLPAPVLLAPIGGQGLVHEDGELAAAAAGSALGLPYVLSNASTHEMEAVADSAGSGPTWFQLYVSSHRPLWESLVDRAERAGYDVLVVTVDNPYEGWRPQDVEQISPEARPARKGNYFTDPVFEELLEVAPAEHPADAMELYREIYRDPALTWDDIEEIIDYTELPVVLKGILRPDDARRAVDVGARGIVVSSHGGNCLDGAIPALDALVEIRKTVTDVPLLFDSGIRTGTDVYKALALGANAVLVGRPYLYGLAIAGEPGVRGVMKNLVAELDFTMANAGVSDVTDIDDTSVTEYPPGH